MLYTKHLYDVTGCSVLKYDDNKPAEWHWRLLPLKETNCGIINQVTPDVMSNSPFDTQAYTEGTWASFIWRPYY